MASGIEDIDTPAVLVDVDKVERNLRRAQQYADSHGLKLRPHIKTHKLPVFAHRQMALGAVGITCQKLGEAEVMADAGLNDILLPYNIVGAAKLHRLVALNKRTVLSVSCDSQPVAGGYAEAMAAARARLTVLVECDTGAGRCGVQTPAEAVALARTIMGYPHLHFAGLMTYPAVGKQTETGAWLAEAVALLAADGIACPVVSSGGSPDLWSAHNVGGVTEYRPGTYIYLDRYQVTKGVGSFDDCALTVAATVVSRPTFERAVIDAGSKALTSDTLGLPGYGYIPEYPEAAIVALSEEHGTIDVSRCARKPPVGERITIIPNHACVVSNQFDEVYLASGGKVVETVPVAARGKLG